LQNTSDILATEKVQVYAKFTDTRTTTPNFQLCGLAQVECKGGETVTTQITVEKYWLKAVLEDGSRVLPNGQLTLYVGGHQPDSRSNELCTTPCLSIQIM
jgi:beta-glucosidase